MEGLTIESVSLESLGFLFGISTLFSSTLCRLVSNARASVDGECTAPIGAKNLSPVGGKVVLVGSRLGLGGRECEDTLAR